MGEISIYTYLYIILICSGIGFVIENIWLVMYLSANDTVVMKFVGIVGVIALIFDFLYSFIRMKRTKNHYTKWLQVQQQAQAYQNGHRERVSLKDRLDKGYEVVKKLERQINSEYYRRVGWSNKPELLSAITQGKAEKMTAQESGFYSVPILEP